MFPTRRDAILSLLAITLALGAAALADKIDDLCAALRGDPSYRVKAQAALLLGKLKDPRGVAALIQALRDDEEAVRVVAAASLGRIGDPLAKEALRGALDDKSIQVRGAASKALAALDQAPAKSPGGGGGKILLALGSIAPGQAGPEAAKKFQERLSAKLGALPGVTLDEAQAGGSRFFIDGNLKKLANAAPDAEGRIRVDCDVALVVATWPEKSIKMMATVGGSTDASNDPKDIASARDFCLQDATAQFAEKVKTYLDTAKR